MVMEKTRVENACLGGRHFPLGGGANRGGEGAYEGERNRDAADNLA